MSRKEKLRPHDCAVTMDLDQKPSPLDSRLQCFILLSLIVLEEYMTFWGEPEWIHVQNFNMEQLHAHDCHGDVTETSGHRIRQKHAQHRNGESDYSSVKQSSRYVTHSLYGCAAHWQHIVLCKTHGLIPRWHEQESNGNAATPLRLVQARPNYAMHYRYDVSRGPVTERCICEGNVRFFIYYLYIARKSCKHS